MSRLKSDVRLIIIVSIGISCFIGLLANSREVILFYKNFGNINIDIDSGYNSLPSFANTMFIRLKNSDIIYKIKQYLPTNITVGFYSDRTSPEYMAFYVLQNLLAPVLLDRDNPENHEYMIMFLKDKDPDLIALNLKRKIIKEFGGNLYLAIK